jgi:fructokinase
MPLRILCLGEVLFDVYPTAKHLGGAPLNFACHLHQFGCDVTFVTRVAVDESGREIIAHLRQRSFPTTYIQLDAEHPTGSVLVTLNEESVPDFTIIDQVAYDFIQLDDRIMQFAASPVDLIYFGTLAQRHPQSRQTIQSILAAKQSATLIFYDVNLRQSFYTREIIADSLMRSTVVKLNENEFATIRKMFGLSSHNQHAVQELMQQFNLKFLCLTKGGKGSSLYSEAGKLEWSTVLQEQPQVVDTVGAGDAYAAVLAYGLLSGWPPADVIQRAGRFAAMLCAISGALPEDGDFYRRHAPWINHG